MSVESKAGSREGFELGPAEELLIVGGGRALESVAASAVLLGYRVFIATSPRYHDPEDSHPHAARLSLPEGVKVMSSRVLEEAIEGLQLNSNIERINLALGNPWIVSRAQLDTLFGGKLLNCHGTGLPRDRGGGGFSWRIMESNPFGFVNLYLVDHGVDTGPLVEFEEFLFPDYCRIPKDFEEFYINKVVEFIVRKLAELKVSRMHFVPKVQLPYLSTYWPRLKSDTNGWIDWRTECSQLERFVRAFDDPYGGARTLSENQEVRLGKVRLSFSDGRFHPYQSGIVYRKGSNWLCIAANGGSLIVEHITDTNGNSVLDQIKVGDRLHSPHEKLESSMQRVRLNP
jgi:methionyl-tRNA formyltransferase